jgi:hypothetical protein
MQLNQAHEFFEHGLLVQCRICTYPMAANAWLLQFDTRAGDVLTLQSQRDKTPRLFKTLGAAFACANEIGFKQAVIQT